MMTDSFKESFNDILNHYKTSESKGLTSEEVTRRLEEYGYNQLEARRRKTFFRMFIAQFKSFMIIILLIAAAISGAVGVMEGEGLLDTFVILGILILNAFVGAFQKIQESALTGESVPVDKQTDPLTGDDIALGDRINMAFSSGMVTYGRGRGIVVTTGMQTEVGKIADMIQQAEDTGTPMSHRLEKPGQVTGTDTRI